MRYVAIGLTALTAGLVFAGCGGGGDNNSTGTQLQGNTAVQAALVSSYQSFQAGLTYPLKQVQLTLPNGNPYKGVSMALLKSHATSDGTGLFTGALVTTGTTTTLPFFTDAALTHSAGNVSVTAPAGTTLGTYTTYPVVFGIAANITGGALPCTGTGTITLKDAAGAGEIKGTFSLPSTHVSVTADLTLSDAGAIGGTATVQEHGQTITLTDLTQASGNGFTGDITGNVTVAPQGYTGTATLSIAQGTFIVHLNTPNGVASASSDDSGGLNITFPDKTTETITNPLETQPDSTPSTGGGTTGGTTTGGSTNGGGTTVATYNAPIALASTFYPNALNNKGQIVGQTYGGAALYLSSPTATVQNLPKFNGFDESPLAINNNGEILGFGYNSTSNVAWTSPTATPIALGGVDVQGGALNDSGEIVGRISDPYAEIPVAWSNASAQYTELKFLPGDDGGSAEAINSHGVIIGFSFKKSSGIQHPIYWTSAADQPHALVNLSSNPSYDQFGINDAGQIFASKHDNSAPVTVFWQSVTAQPVTLPQLPGATGATNLNLITGGTSINADGTVAGSSTDSTGEVHAVIWKNGQIQDLNTLIPAGSGWVLSNAVAINDNKAILGLGTLTASGSQVGFYIAPK